MDLLVIDFNETATDKVSLGCIVLGDSYDLLEGSGNNASSLFVLVSSHHGMGLSAPGLSVGEDGAVVPFDDVVDEREGALFVNKGLRAFGAKDIVEGKGLGLLFVVFLFEVDLVVFGVQFDDADAAAIDFFFIHGAAPDHNFYALCHL